MYFYDLDDFITVGVGDMVIYPVTEQRLEVELVEHSLQCFSIVR